MIDTSVLLADPGALRRFAEHEVVLPVVVITELEGKRHHPELGILRPLGAADARRAAGRSTAASTSRCRSATRAARSGSSSTTPTRLAAVGLPARRQRHPDPGRRPQPGQRGLRRHAGLQGPAAADQGVGRRARRPGVPRRGDQRLRHRLHRHGRDRGRGRTSSTSSTTTACSTSRRCATCPATRAWCCSPTAAPRWAGSVPTSRCTSCAATARRSASTAGPPSSGSRWRCCSTPRSASSPSVAAPAPASRRWRCAPASRR